MLRPRACQLVPGLPGPEFHLYHAPGWTTFDEGQDSVDLHGYNNHADVSYLFFGIPPQYNTPSSALAHIFQVIGVTVTSVLSTYQHPEPATSSGAVQGVEYVEFLGRSEGLAVHGLVYILTDAGPSGVFGVMRMEWRPPPCGTRSTVALSK